MRLVVGSAGREVLRLDLIVGRRWIESEMLPLEPTQLDKWKDREVKVIS